jgi:protein SCO1
MSNRYWLIVVAVAILAAGAGAYVANVTGRADVPALQSGTALPTPKVLEDFSLVDAQGAPASLATLRGHPTLVFFGFTHCPDICPTTLALLADVQKSVALVDQRLAGLKVALISVDPERDTPAALSAYLNSFGGDLIGLTGSAPEIVKVSRTFGVASARVDLGGGNYTMDHSAAIFAVDSGGRVVAIFTPRFNAASLKADVTALASTLARGQS